MPENYVKWEFERDRCVLLVVDMQNDFVNGGGLSVCKNAGPQVPAIRKLIAKCRALGVPVIYTMQESDPRYNPLEAASQPHLKTAGIISGTPGYQIVDELAPEPGDEIIHKRRFSAFFQTDLEIILRNIRGAERPADTVIICGTVANVCCESTARDAFFRDYKVVFGTDVNSAKSPEALAATLRNMENLFGRTMDSDTIIASLERGRG